MAISPPSDLVLDVVRAADPAEVQQAQAKLKSNRAAFEATSLAEAGNGFNAAVGILNRDSASTVSATGSAKATDKAVPETYRKFEAMVLQNFVKSMLPAESEDVYGKGTAGEIWRGMMAEQIGDVIAKGGGIGIAETLVKDSKHVTPTIERETRGVATSMVQELQREAFADLTPGVKNQENS
ncbi:rod-binding protein [Sinorhizobium sp. BG8]|uniref:rod-binding protein n=1 Tax=Sinorhizobium sp. BG8 TaxID=2613773 RepID=UPI00193E83D5|nr:rod-binding protein [Sinorhizobium sp. BG8]QRM54258.1 rod-binding protein [Sinorhizobium sp. BG8]